MTKIFQLFNVTSTLIDFMSIRAHFPCETVLIPIMLNNNKPLAVIQKREPITLHSQSIGTIASSFYFVDENAMVDDLATELNKNEDIYAVGVVDKNGAVTGVIPRNDLFDVLSKPFGRDIYKNREVSSITFDTRVFNVNSNIFTVASEISEHLKFHRIYYYLVVTGDNRFAGIFSSKDLLIYLSDMTQKDIAMAKRLQSCIVKNETHIVGKSCEIIGASDMAKGVGGDFYAIQEYETGRWNISLCDVSGKGVSASLLSVIIGGMTSIYDFTRGLDDYLSSLNNFIFTSFEAERFITGLFLDFREKEGAVTVYDAGHSYLYIYRDGTLERVESDAELIPIGIMGDFKPEGRELALKNDDLLVLVSDGIEEQKNEHEELYGTERLLSVIRENCQRGLKELKDEIYSDVLRFRQDHPQYDDMTMVMLRYRG